MLKVLKIMFLLSFYSKFMVSNLFKKRGLELIDHSR